ncbi:OmpA family protein [Guyparkeria hydrothermalis]|uniref:OmpA family protein n=1 Tax=Guyparkeria halophila TaxID=47960 RepID=A0A6I6D2U3_9GAMM|nr:MULTISPECIES: OmpA family protein [Guyparkeria]MCL7751204.1 OmpA family protein [Guyparkeria hydrothermalis]QGT77651.1 OmpA family protein [Guyparkeria halophila]TKA88301.1 OmpA family protein [Guyparkeria sp. SB14A]
MKRMTLIAVAASALLAAGCAQNPYTSEQDKTAKGATIGAGAGAILGNVIAGSGNKTGGTLIGAAVGATVGGLVGRQMDEQERQLRQEMQGTGVDVQRQGDTIRLQAPESITFDTNSADIKPQFRSALDQLARSIQQYPNTVVRVEGHTDSTGSASYNQDLSLNRAQSVTSYLARSGVDASRLQPVGYGFSRPIATNDTPEGRAQNRRVEILILPAQQQ